MLSNPIIELKISTFTSKLQKIIAFDIVLKLERGLPLNTTYLIT